MKFKTVTADDAASPPSVAEACDDEAAQAFYLSLDTLRAALIFTCSGAIGTASPACSQAPLLTLEGK